MDAAILVAAARGRSSGALRRVVGFAVLVTTSRAVDEARRRIELGMGRADLLPILDALTSLMAVVPIEDIVALVPAAEDALSAAVASRNGSTRDAHILSLAWRTDSDIWTTDRDFAGTGVTTWSTPNLITALASAS